MPPWYHSAPVISAGNCVAKRAQSRGRLLAALMLSGTVLATLSADPASAQSVGAASLNGAPVQVLPYVKEPGAPAITITPGTLNPLAGDDGSNSGSGGSTGSNVSDTDSLGVLLDTSYGAAAIANAQSVGVNPSALAATCVQESTTCTSSSSGGSGAQGPFQMYPAAFQEGLQTALAANPALASQIVQGSAGIDDPTTEAIAASGYLIQGADALQASGISDPTVTQVRGYYQFGPADGTALANASQDATLGSVLTHTSATTLANNGLTPSTTVAQYDAIVAAKVGNAANQSVLT